MSFNFQDFFPPSTNQQTNSQTNTISNPTADLSNTISNLDNTISNMDSLVNEVSGVVSGVDTTVQSINSILSLIFSFLNPGTTREAIEHFTQILKTIVFAVVIFVSGLLSFVISGALKIFLPMKYTFSLIVFLLSIVGVVGALMLLSKLYVLDTLDSSGQELANVISDSQQDF